MEFKEALSVLSKSSPYAVATDKSRQDSSLLNDIKNYLYIEMSIEKDINKALYELSQKKQILFLCGSSGDGKSELLIRAKKEYEQTINFHLDATHSFTPRGTAIETLNQVFNNYYQGNKSLIVGINTGMLANYANEGDNQEIKSAISNYFSQSITQSSHIKFINFEDYPKFVINEHKYTSEFAEKFLKRLTSTEKGNTIRQLFEIEKMVNNPGSQKLIANFALLNVPSVQTTIIDLLFKARLMRDQFLTARAFLDFIHGLLLEDGYLFDNLFAGGANELANKIEDFDPANLRTKEIDRFILAYDLNLPDKEFNLFKDALQIFGITGLETGAQYLRLFYVLKYEDFANNFHKQFKTDFNASLIDKYIEIYQLHKCFDDKPDQKVKIKAFYRDILIAAIRNYINRNAPNLGRKYFLLSDFGEYQVAAPADLSIDLTAIKENKTTNSAFFDTRLKLKNKKFTLPMNINLLALLVDINNGYRPNKHDKNAVILLDELANEIIQEAKLSNELVITSNKQKYFLELDDEEIMVSEG